MINKTKTSNIIPWVIFIASYWLVDHMLVVGEE